MQGAFVITLASKTDRVANSVVISCAYGIEMVVPRSGKYHQETAAAQAGSLSAIGADIFSRFVICIQMATRLGAFPFSSRSLQP